MTGNDRLRAARALQADWNDLDAVRNAVRALQSTDAPCLLPLHDKYMERMKELETAATKQYAVGFAFSEDKQHVLLVLKAKPAWQKGLMNGIGGKVEETESPIAGMVREFHEEAQVVSQPDNWRLFAIMYDRGGEVYCFTTTLSPETFKTASAPPGADEQVYSVRVLDIPTERVIPNLRYLIPLALDDSLSEPVRVAYKN